MTPTRKTKPKARPAYKPQRGDVFVCNCGVVWMYSPDPWPELPWVSSEIVEGDVWHEGLPSDAVLVLRGGKVRLAE